MHWVAASHLIYMYLVFHLVFHRHLYHCRTLAQDYDVPKPHLETNEIQPGMMNDYSPVDNVNPSMQQILTKKQRKLVEKNPGSIVAVAQGALQAIRECQYQFHTRRWNCPTKDSNVGGSIFGRILNVGEC